ncbi:MAG: S8 family serine peptidase [Candidatus Thermoplasmatota archaeon]|nr:S8 family serine peptidase [Candidatus Thermoplasmatota archaeon]
MKPMASILVLLMVLMPIGAAIDLPAGEKDGREGSPDPWMAPMEKELGEVPWWERTIFDMNGDGISDILEPYASLPGTDQILTDVTISFSRDVTNDDVILLERRGFDISTPLEIIDAIALRNVPSYRIYELMNLPDVVFIEPLGVPILFSDVANPTVRAKQSDNFSPMTAWDLGYQGRGVSIAVIDTGIDDEHPSLDGKFLGGVDMTKPDNLPLLYPQDGTYNPDDIQGHGSTCSGIAVGTGAPEGLYQGPGCEACLVDVRIGTKIGYAPGEFWVGALADPHLKDGTLRGIRWATDNLDTSWENGGPDYKGIDIYSISWGVDVGSPSDGTDQYSRLLDAAVEAGAVVINAAGNEGPTNNGFTALSASSEAIIVAATVDMETLDLEDDVVAWYSSRGPRHDNGDGNPYDELKPDIAAPGTNITQLQPDTTRITGDASNNGYGSRGSGTSYATPLVAGVVSLLLEANPQLEGQNEIVKEVLKYTADRKKSATYPELDPFWEKDFGYGVIDAYAACRLAAAIPDVGKVDPRLQAHITNVSLSTIAYTQAWNHTVKVPYYDHVATGPFTVSGLAWSKGGQYEGVQYQVVGPGTVGPDPHAWLEIRDRSNDTFNPWSLKIDDLEDGVYTLYVRSVAGNSESLYSFIEFTYHYEGGKESMLTGGGSLLLIIIGIIAAIGVTVFIFYRTRKSNITP